MKARIAHGARDAWIDLQRPIDLSIPIEFDGTGPLHFGAPRPVSRPLSVGDFSGSVATGASCNCRTISLTPHCNGTHTECVGHLTRESIAAWPIVPQSVLSATLVSVVPEQDAATRDQIITHEALHSAWPSSVTPRSSALLVRTLPNATSKRTRDYTSASPPYFTVDAIGLMIARGIEHLVVDLPSIDRTHDAGQLLCHRKFFGLAPDARSAADAMRPKATITELAYIDDTVQDGTFALQIQAPAIDGDAVPSRPLLYRYAFE